MFKKFSKKIFILLPLVIILFSATHLQVYESPYSEQPCGFTFNINNSSVPDDICDNFSREDLINYAWQHFIALNWPSKYSNADYQGGQIGGRGEPSTTSGATFSSVTASNQPLLTWHTYAHKREYLGAGVTSLTEWDQLGSPKYLYTDLTACYPQANPNLFNNLDENSQLSLCTAFGGSGVHGTGGGNIILFEAKVNKDNYDYVRKQELFEKDILKTVSANTKTTANLLKYGATDTPCPDGVLCFPRGGNGVEGSIETKAAWRKLKEGEDPNRFYTQEVVIYAEQGPNGQETYCYENETYALLGLHIIHKSKNLPAYMLATWQHKYAKEDGLYYRNNDANVGKPQYFKDDNDSTGIARLGTIVAGNIGISEQAGNFHEISPDVAAVTDAVHEALPSNSIWQNYELTGVQGIPVNSPRADPDYFLANIFIESNIGLQKYQGKNSSNSTNKSKGGIVLDHENTYYKGKKYNVGGCQGCHGQAQSKSGFDFSFLLFGVQSAGKSINPEPADEPHNVSIMQKRAFELSPN